MKQFLSMTVCLNLLFVFQAQSVTAQDHGHDHGANAAEHAQEVEVPTVAVTQWTDSMELFMEYPEMVAMRSGRFIIHLTVLDGFQPVREGKVTLGFTAPNGAREVRTADTLLREGIFAPDIGLRDAAEYAFDLTYEGPGVSSTFRIPGFRVYASTDAIHAHAEDVGDEIVFLKEQQWKIPFATAPAVQREMKRSIWAIGQVLPAQTAYVEIAAPINGTVLATDAGDLALPGAYVKNARSACVRRTPSRRANTKKRRTPTWSAMPGTSGLPATATAAYST